MGMAGVGSLIVIGALTVAASAAPGTGTKTVTATETYTKTQIYNQNDAPTTFNAPATGWARVANLDTTKTVAITAVQNDAYDTWAPATHSTPVRVNDNSQRGFHWEVTFTKVRTLGYIG
jgi:hypothetical protein